MWVQLDHLAMLVGEASLVAALLLTTFRLRSRLGLSLLAIALGVLQPLQVELSATMYVEPIAGFLVSPGSVVLFVGTIFAVLLVYIREDAFAVRKIIYGLVAANVAVSVLYFVIGWHLAMPATRNLLDTPPDLYRQEARVMVAGSLALVLDVVLIMAVYDALGRVLRGSVFLRVYLAMVAVLAVDSVVFATAAFLGKPLFFDALVAGFAGKSAMSLLFAGALAAYLRYFEREGAPAWQHSESRLRDVFHALTYREKYELHRVAAKASLDREAARRDAVLEATSDGIMTIRGGRIEEVNAACARLFGVARDTLRGADIGDYITSTRVLGDLRGGAAIDGPVELLGRRPNGTFPAELVVGRTDGDSGPELVLAIRDISARKRQFEQGVQTSKMEAVGQLAGGIAHDFNNLLTVILGASSMIERGPDEDANLKMIQEAAGRAAQLTGQLLSFARKQVLNPTTVDLNEHVRRLGDMLRRLIGEERTLELDLAQDALAVQVSPSLLDQVIVNLVANARDASPRGGVIRISTARFTAREGADLPAGDFATLSVTDHGDGIAPENLERIFEPYFTTKDVGRGTGLGLSVCMGIVEQSGGRISVESTLAKGTTFTITLPQSTQPAAPVATDGPQAPARDSGHRRVLLVDDNEHLRELLARVLSDGGFEVLCARGGEEALRLAAEFDDLDLLVSDFVMPGMRGDELAARMRELRPRVRVLLMSGHPQDAVGDGNEELEWPMLSKPFTPKALLRAAHEVLVDGAPVDPGLGRGDRSPGSDNGRSVNPPS